MKIVQINAVYGILSTGRSTKEIAEYLRAQGHDCITFYGEHRVRSDHAYYVGSWLDHKLHGLWNRLIGRRGYGSVCVTRMLVRKLLRYKPDVVHLRNLHSNYVNIPLLLDFLAKHNIPTVTTLHDCFFFTGGCTHYTVNGCYKWQTQCRECEFLKRGEDFWLVNGAEKDFNIKLQRFSSIPRLAVVGVSDWITQQAQKSQVLSRASIYKRIYNWIDLDKFSPLDDQARRVKRQLYGFDNKAVLLGVAAVWTATKGLRDFIALSQILPEDYVIVLIGQMPAHMQLPSNVVSVAPTHSIEELAEYYSMADVFLQLSLEETFGKVTAEALACGTPCVVYDSTANAEILDEYCGEVVSTVGGIRGVYDAVIRIRQVGREGYTRACRNRAMMCFDKEVNLKEHMDLYQEIIAKR